MTKRQLQHTAKEAFYSQYGVAPKVSQIVLLESGEYSDRLYIRFAISGTNHEYTFSSYYDSDGCLWVGLGTLEQVR